MCGRVSLCVFTLAAIFAAGVAVLYVEPAQATEPVKIYAQPEKQDDGSVKGAIDSGNTAWMLMSTALVLMMTGPGLALFYGGLVRRKNVLSTMMHSFVLMAVVSVVWALVGYSLAFDAGTPFIGGLRFALLREVGQAPAEYADSIPHSVWMAFQMMFAIITPALISGAYAERIRFGPMVVFSVCWLLLVYCPMAHMVWGKGGLFNAFNGGRIPAIDFAGGTVVHIASGVSALVCAVYLGRRKGYGEAPMLPHSVRGAFGDRGGAAVGGLVRIQRRQRSVRRRAGGQRPGGDTSGSMCRGHRLGRLRMVAHRQADGPGSDIGRGGRTGGNHARVGVRHAHVGPDHGSGGRKRMFHGLHKPEAPVRLR